MKGSSSRWASLLVAFGVVLAAVLAPVVGVLGTPVLVASAQAATTPVNGGGSGFAGLEIQQWQADTARKPYNLSVNYSSQSSGVGRNNFASGLYDYGVSDIIYQNEESALTSEITAKRCPGQGACYRYVPVSAGGLSFMYNLTNGSSRVTDLHLTPKQVCQIFTQQVTTWSQLDGNNPELASNQNPIKVVTRNDAAGESFILSQFCIATDGGDWTNFVNYQKTIPGNLDGSLAELDANKPISYWPPQLSAENANQLQESGADGVANTVADPIAGKNSITYDAAGYALVRNFPVAYMLNPGGQYQLPNEANVDAALAYATPDGGTGTFVLDYTGGNPAAYFPSTYSYAIVQTTGEDPSRGSTIGQFLCYAVGKGQTIAPDLRYARLSSQIVAISVSAITAIPGAPSASDCTAGAPAAPSLPTVGGAAAGAIDTTTGATGGAGSTGNGPSAAALAAEKLAESGASTTLSPEALSAQKALAAAKKAAANAHGSGSGGGSGGNALWFLILGAAVCAIGVGASSAARRTQ